MIDGFGTVRAFLEPMREPPRKPPMPRRFALSLLFPVAVTLCGGVAFILHAGIAGSGHPLPKPGPRRYPPGYRRKTADHRPAPRPAAG